MFNKLLKDHYSFEGDFSVELLRSYTNDVYLVKDQKRKYILKVYGQTWRTKEEILWEIDLVEYLSSMNVPVANVVPSINGERLRVSEDNGKQIFFVLFEFASGEKPKPPFEPKLQYEVGKAAAYLHIASDNFQSDHKRSSIDLKYLIDDSLLIARRTIEDKDDLKIYEDLAYYVKDKILEFNRDVLDWGPIHGDLTLDNLHVTREQKIVFYDFDSSGFGWRAMELYGWVVLNPDKKANVEAYLEGYQKVRPINQINIKAAPYLQAASDIWLKKGMKALSDQAVLKSQLRRIKEWAEYFKC